MTVYDDYAPQHSLPSYNFAPWGWRNQCYLIGLLCGYLLYLTKDREFRMDRSLNIIMWNIVSVAGLVLVYGPYVMKIPNYPSTPDLQ